MTTKPVIAGVHLPSAADEAKALAEWARGALPYGALCRLGVEDHPAFVVLRTQVSDDFCGLIVVLVQANQGPKDLSAREREWVVVLTRECYSVRICAGFLEAQREVTTYFDGDFA